MRTTLTYRYVEWHALITLLNRPGAHELVEPGLPTRVLSEVGRSWLAGKRETAIELCEADAVIVRLLRAGLPDAEVLAAIAEAESIVRAHQHQHQRRAASR
jgi:hypothetical protein